MANNLDNIAGTIGRIGELMLAEERQREQTMLQLAFLKRQENFKMEQQAQNFQDQLESTRQRQDHELNQQFLKQQAALEKEEMTLSDKREIERLKAATKLKEAQELAKKKGILGKKMAEFAPGGTNPQEASALEALSQSLGIPEKESPKFTSLMRPEQSFSDKIQEFAQFRELGAQIDQKVKAQVELTSIKQINKDIDAIVDTFNAIPQDLLGPIEGRTKGKFADLMRTNADLAAYQDSRKLSLTLISRKIFENVGTLSDRDIAIIDKGLPTLADTPESAGKKVELLRTYLRNRIVGKGSIISGEAFGKITTGQFSDEERKAVLNEVKSETSLQKLPQSGLTPAQTRNAKEYLKYLKIHGVL